jgi:putative heme-binding domain-containing protein
VRDVILERIGRRYAAEGSPLDFDTCVKLLEMASHRAATAPVAKSTNSSTATELLLRGIEQALSGRTAEQMPLVLRSWFNNAWTPTNPSLTFIRFGLLIGNPQVSEIALKLLEDPQTLETNRLGLIEIVAQTGAQEFVPLLFSVFQQGESLKLRSAALTALQRFADPQIARKILGLYSKLNADLQNRARNALANRATWANELVEAVEDGRIPSAVFTLEQIRQLSMHQDPELKQRIEKRWGKVHAESAGEKQSFINKLKLVLKPSGVAARTGKGDPAAGRTIFQQSCAVCHTLFDEGNRIGPDLTSADRKNTESMLNNIVNPSAYIRPEYVNYELQTKDDQIISGLLVESTPTAATILDRNNQRTIVARERVKSIKESAVSLMPDGLLEALTPRQIMDLFTYLQGNGPLVKKSLLHLPLSCSRNFLFPHY